MPQHAPAQCQALPLISHLEKAVQVGGRLAAAVAQAEVAVGAQGPAAEVGRALEGRREGRGARPRRLFGPHFSSQQRCFRLGVRVGGWGYHLSLTRYLL